MPLRTLEHYLNSDKRILLAQEITRLAKIYKDSFDKLSIVCSQSYSMNATALIFNATHILENKLPVNELLPEAVEAAKSLLTLDIAKKNFSDDGIPYVLSLELTRRVLDVDIIGSREIVYTYDK
jgi:hypothetical protein